MKFFKDSIGRRTATSELDEAETSPFGDVRIWPRISVNDLDDVTGGVAVDAFRRLYILIGHFVTGL